jgi:RelE toxin of RelEB toxin-antitoxin system
MLTIIETPTFQKRSRTFWNIGEYEEFIAYIAFHPEAGSVVPGTGGVRKLRWQGSGKGKRGGTRVIYFCSRRRELWLLTLYPKHQRETMSAKELMEFRKAVDEHRNE